MQPFYLFPGTLSIILVTRCSRYSAITQITFAYFEEPVLASILFAVALLASGQTLHLEEL